MKSSNKNKNNKNRRYFKKAYNAYGSLNSAIITTVQNPLFGFINPRAKSALKFNTVTSSAILTTAGTSISFKANAPFFASCRFPSTLWV